MGAKARDGHGTSEQKTTPLFTIQKSSRNLPKLHTGAWKVWLVLAAWHPICRVRGKLCLTLRCVLLQVLQQGRILRIGIPGSHASSYRKCDGKHQAPTKRKNRCPQSRRTWDAKSGSWICRSSTTYWHFVEPGSFLTAMRAINSSRFEAG
jgi:hypothetical protein